MIPTVVMIIAEHLYQRERPKGAPPFADAEDSSAYWYLRKRCIESAYEIVNALSAKYYHIASHEADKNQFGTPIKETT